MNIFITDKCPIKSAKYLDTKRVNKMILESAQMLSTAIRLQGIEDPALYKSTHQNHPSNVWARKTRQNFLWLLRHFKALVEEYKFRRGKVHKSYLLYITFIKYADIFPNLGLTEFANCAANDSKGISYKHIADVTKAYQLYLNDRWETDKLTPTWE